MPKKITKRRKKKVEVASQKKVELHPDLVQHLRPGGPFGISLHHPLYVLLPYKEMDNSYINDRYLAMKVEVEQALKDGKWYSFVFFHERAYRLDALLKIESEIKKCSGEDAWWELVGEVWSDAERIHENRDNWEDIFQDTPTPAIMEEEERRQFKKLPDPLIVYRGHGNLNANGWSWTTSERRAIWFARRFLNSVGHPKLSKLSVRKEQVIAYFTRREEHEVVIHPDDCSHAKSRLIRNDECSCTTAELKEDWSEL